MKCPSVIKKIKSCFHNQAACWITCTLRFVFWVTTLISYPSSHQTSIIVREKVKKDSFTTEKWSTCSKTSQIIVKKHRKSSSERCLNAVRSVMFLTIVFPIHLYETYETIDIINVSSSNGTFSHLISNYANLVYAIAYLSAHFHAIFKRNALSAIMKKVIKMSHWLHYPHMLQKDVKFFVILSFTCIGSLVYIYLAGIALSFGWESLQVLSYITNFTNLHFRLLTILQILILYISMKTLSLFLLRIILPFEDLLRDLQTGDKCGKFYQSKQNKHLEINEDCFWKMQEEIMDESYFQIEKLRCAKEMVNNYFKCLVLVLLVFDITYISSLLFLTQNDDFERLRCKIILTSTAVNFFAIITSQNSFEFQVSSFMSFLILQHVQYSFNLLYVTYRSFL